MHADKLTGAYSEHRRMMVRLFCKNTVKIAWQARIH